MYQVQNEKKKKSQITEKKSRKLYSIVSLLMEKREAITLYTNSFSSHYGRPSDKRYVYKTVVRTPH